MLVASVNADLTSTEPFYVLDARADPTRPMVLAEGKTPGFMHANLWPHGGTDDFLLAGGEAIGPRCAEDTSASFMTFDARRGDPARRKRKVASAKGSRLKRGLRVKRLPQSLRGHRRGQDAQRPQDRGPALLPDLR